MFFAITSYFHHSKVPPHISSYLSKFLLSFVLCHNTSCPRFINIYLKHVPFNVLLCHIPIIGLICICYLTPTYPLSFFTNSCIGILPITSEPATTVGTYGVISTKNPLGWIHQHSVSIVISNYRIHRYQLKSTLIKNLSCQSDKRAPINYMTKNHHIMINRRTNNHITNNSHRDIETTT